MKQTVVALTWTMKDSLGEVLDTLDEPVEFYVGGEDLLPSIESALLGKREGETLSLYLEPEHAFGDYDENLVYLEARHLFPEEMEEGMVLEGRSLPAGAVSDVDADLLLSVTEIYPEHVVLDGNHPLAGIALQLEITIKSVRPSTVDEQRRGSTGIGFFKISPDEDLKPPTLH